METVNPSKTPTVRNNKPRKSYKFGDLSLYYDGRYYFVGDIKDSDRHPEGPYEIQVVYFQGKWYQDGTYITKEFKQFLLDSLA